MAWSWGTAAFSLPSAGQRRPVANFNTLEKVVSGYLGQEDIKEIRRAYEFGSDAHGDQTRMSGEPYISHPLSVGCILGDMRLDRQTIVSAILHDTIEDTDTALSDLRQHFGPEVEHLVSGVTKLDKIRFDSHKAVQAGNLRKMLLAMTDDIRVVLIKLADRLHNMRTLSVLAPEKRRRIAKETLEIYAPIALRLGMNSMRLELEETAFQHAYPQRYKILEQHVRQARMKCKRLIARVLDALDTRLREERLNAVISGREKHLYGIYQKIRDKHIPFKDISDLQAFRVITESVPDCYLALGHIHNLYKPVPGRFKDYIALPKKNGYQSLHTVLFGPHSMPIEVQIRTADMDRMAETGMAAHWLYKTAGGAGSGRQAPNEHVREWVRSVLDLQQAAGDPEEFLDHFKMDLFPDEVYIFTPDGDIRKLSRGATVLDMAYAIHTDIGHHCTGGRIEGSHKPLHAPLRSGQTVEILTSPLTQPGPGWLNCAVTARARAHIRQYLKGLKDGEARQLGKHLLNGELRVLSSSYGALPRQVVHDALKRHNLSDEKQLFEEVGLGNLPARLIARELVPDDGREAVADDEQPLLIRGTEGMVISFARCCHPLPGDPITGYMNPGRGVIIHRSSCGNVRDLHKQREDRLLTVEWAAKSERADFVAGLRVDVVNQPGVLAAVASAIASQGGDVTHVEIGDNREQYTTLRFDIVVRDTNHLQSMMHHLSRVPYVEKISRH